MPKNWKKGFKKSTHPSIAKMVETFKVRKIDNLREWREEMVRSGVFGGDRELEKNGDLAELIGMILGDGSIHVYQRTEGLRIVLPSERKELIDHYAVLVEKIFHKKPSIIKRKKERCTDIRLYQQNISTRLEIPSGARGKLVINAPQWILKNQNFVIRYLRGLYEAEGCFCVHEPTYTYKFIFTNRNQSLLDIVFTLVNSQGFHPHRSRYQIQISKKKEVYEAMELFQFRKY